MMAGGRPARRSCDVGPVAHTRHGWGVGTTGGALRGVRLSPKIGRPPSPLPGGRMSRRAVQALAAAVFLLHAPLGAQTLRDEIVQLFTFGTCGEPLCLEGALGGHGGRFIPAA